MDIFRRALDYYDRGWSIIPLRPGEKKPPRGFRWKDFQIRRPTRKQVEKWFSSGDKNIGIICGPVSGLTVIDFDVKKLYHEWIGKHPQLASMPTVETARGYHVYCRSGLARTKMLDGIDLKASGYVVAPPSRHPSGSCYRWAVPLNGSSLPEIDLTVFEPLHTDNIASAAYTASAASAASTSKVEKEESGVFSFEIPEVVGVFIEQTLPKPGENRPKRNQQIFQFIRKLRSLPEFRDADPRGLRHICRAWHKAALPFIQTKEFSETWSDFNYAWPRVCFPEGVTPATVWEKVKDQDPPEEVVSLYPDEKGMHDLATLCRGMQKESLSDRFFLACRDAAALTGGCYRTASTRLNALVYDRILELVQKGRTKENPLASYFRYLPPIE